MFVIEIGKIALVIKPTRDESIVYFPKFWSLKVGKWNVELRIGCVKDSLKALEAILNGGELW